MIKLETTFFVSVLIILLRKCQTSDRLIIQNPCVGKTSCRECIQTKECAWCLQPDYDVKPRCFQPNSNNSDCPFKYTWNPKNEEKLVIKEQLSRSSFSSSGRSLSSESISSSSSSGSAKITQIYPQRVSLKCRINEKHRLAVQYSQAEDYPVDLYYLMDLSQSMKDDKQNLLKLGDILTSTMRNMTSNFKLGFGSFVDKVLMPYTQTNPKKLKQPCDDGCEAPYGFRNHLPLSTNPARFSEEVKNAKISANLDTPEGGFDAIMQAVVCREQIGWRDQARRLLVFSTDAEFHYAGDGKLGGIIIPNDGKCHLEEGMYTYSTIQDYPSISQINFKVKENSINVIFAVTQQEINVYNKLSEHVEGSSSAVLSDDSSNVVDLVRSEYSKISSSVEMKDTASSAIQITYFSSCLGGGKEIQTNKCDGLKVGDVVNFTAEIVVRQCPPNPKNWLQTFQIYPVGINESLTVDLEMLCSCECESKGEPKSPKCKFQGTHKCGICECDKNFFGRTCECSLSEVFKESERNFVCRPNNETLVDCSGRGKCVCGICECEKRHEPTDIISGKFCECDNFSCDRHNDVVCSGTTHGTCRCGTCECLAGWTGSACECQASTDTCKTANIKEICSGHGECICGKCRCHATEEARYSGTYCEKCPTCEGRCQEFKDCVQCQMYNAGLLKEKEDCSKNCTQFTSIGVKTVVVDEGLDEHLCTFYDQDDCKFQFIYSDKEPDNIIIRAQQQRDCPPKIMIIWIVLAVIAAIVIVGLAVLLLWKLLTTIHDRREFARFENERMMAKWDAGGNPIYKEATSTFKNPTYAEKQE